MKAKELIEILSKYPESDVEVCRDDPYSFIGEYLYFGILSAEFDGECFLIKIPD